MATFDLEDSIRSGVEKALNQPVIDGKSIAEWAEIGIKAPRWISVNDQLPELYADVFGYAVCKDDPDDYLIVYTYLTKYPSSDNWLFKKKDGPEWCSPHQFFSEDYEITHWLKVPELPKEEAQCRD